MDVNKTLVRRKISWAALGRCLRTSMNVGWESQTSSWLLRDQPMNSEMHVQKSQWMPRKTFDASKLKLFLVSISPNNCQRLFHDHVVSGKPGRQPACWRLLRRRWEVVSTSVYLLDPAFEEIPRSCKEGEKIKKKEKKSNKLLSSKCTCYFSVRVFTMCLLCSLSLQNNFSDIHISDVKNGSLFPAKLETSFSKRNVEFLPKTVYRTSVESVISREKEDSQGREKGSHDRLF